MLPAYYLPVSNEYAEDFAAQIAPVAEAVERGEAVIVHFSALAWRRYLPGEDYFGEQLKLPVLYQHSTGTIYGTDNSTEGQAAYSSQRNQRSE